MQIAFSSKELRLLCEVQANAEETLGITVARVLRNRLQDIADAEQFTDLPAGTPTEIDGTDFMSISLGDTMHLIVKSNHNRTPRNDDDAVEWNRVSRIQLLDIKVR